MTLEELQAVNYHWRLAIDQFEEGLLILQGSLDDPRSVRVVFSNRSFTEKTGYSHEESLGISLAELLPNVEAQRFLSALNASAPKSTLEGNFGLRTRDGTIVRAQWKVSSRNGIPERTPDHTVTLSWLAPARELGDDHDHAFELSKADTISHIAKGIVHDFNNSLMAIRGHLEVAQPDLPNESAAYYSVLQAMHAVDTTGELCRRLLNYTKGRSAEKQPCLVSEIVHQAIAITSLGATVTCKRLIQKEVWPVMADGIQIVQVINNLLTNAQQAMPHGGIITLVAENVPVGKDSTLGLPPGNYVALTVRDRGVGIPEEYRSRIFDSLFTTKDTGTGLGLATCARIVSNHQGFIDVNSTPNYGSEFIVYLPAATTEPIHSPRIEPTPRRSPFRPISRLKLLLIEDQPGIAKVSQMYLEKIGHQVTWAANGQESLRAFRQAWDQGDPFDLVLVDLTLPGGMDGEDAFRELRQIDPQVIAVATSGSLDHESLPAFQEKGFAAILPKPFPLQKLSEVVQEAMAAHLV